MLTRRRHVRWPFVALILAAIAFVTPMFWVVLSSLKAESEIGAVPLRVLPAAPTSENYQLAVTLIDFGRYLQHSLELAVIYTIPTVITSALVGYAFARWSAPGSRLMFGLVIGTLLVPLFVFVVPLFVIYSKVGMLNTYWPWFLWGVAGNPFLIFLCRQFFLSIPRELEEAAEIDGAGRFGTIWRIVMPISRGLLATCAILAFTSVWGEVLVQSLFLNLDSTTTLSVRLASGYRDATGHAPLVGPLLAGVVVYTIPVLAIFLIAQRQIVQGTATTGFK